MLPAPVSGERRKAFRRFVSPKRRFLDTLLTRSRATNLAVGLLAAVCVVSLVSNLRFYLSGSSPKGYQLSSATGLLSTINRPSKLSSLDHLIVVPCHAIWKGVDAASRLDENDWVLEPYQRGSKRIAAFYDHILHGANLAGNDTRALLVFSGGQTRPTSPSTEAESYYRLALSAKLLDQPKSDPIFDRTTTENYALDSYQNLLFSIARFREFTGRIPKRITVVGYGFKKARFTDLHRKAIRWPQNRFYYIGVDPEDEQHSLIAQEGERVNGYLPYSMDLYGCRSFLLSKRQQRNPFSRFHSYYVSFPELGPLLDWCPDNRERDTTLFLGPLPWDHLG